MAAKENGKEKRKIPEESDRMTFGQALIERGKMLIRHGELQSEIYHFLEEREFPHAVIVAALEILSGHLTMEMKSIDN
eukprot:3931636-Rhodomonas_salina.1